MKINLLSGILFLVQSLNASEHRHQGSHEHGAGKIGIAFEGANGKMDFRIPSESIFGFEHEAKSAKHRAAQKSGLTKLEKNISQMVAFEPSLQCVISTDKIEIVKEKSGSHSDTAAAYSIKCAKSPAGSAITFSFQKEFPKIKDLDVEVVVDSLQKSIEVKESGVRLELK